MVRMIEVEGKDRPFNFGSLVMSQFCDLKGKKIDEIAEVFQNLTLSEMIKLTHMAAKDGCRKQREEVDFTYEDVADWFDGNAKLYSKVMDFVTEALPKVFDLDEDEAKKTAVKKKN